MQGRIRVEAGEAGELYLAIMFEEMLEDDPAMAADFFETFGGGGEGLASDQIHGPRTEADRALDGDLLAWIASQG